MFNLNELKFLRKLNSPQKIQDYLNSLPFNFEKNGETIMSPRRVLKEKKAHCLEGALLAAAAIWVGGGRPLLLDLKTTREDMEHVVALFKKFGRWGAISKTNHTILRYREPVYKTVRELAMSYFHEYFLESRKKTLRSFSKPFSLAKLGKSWLTAEDDLFFISEALDKVPHEKILTPEMERNLRKIDPIEVKVLRLTDW